MEIDGKTITLDASLWAQYENVSVKTAGDRIVLTGKDEASYLKIFNHFGRVLTLLVFEGGQWVEAGTSRPVKHVDLSQAGRVAAVPPTGKTKPKAGAGKSGPGKSRAAKAKSGAKAKAATKQPAAPKAGAKAKARTGTRAQASAAKAGSAGKATSAASAKAKAAPGKSGGAKAKAAKPKPRRTAGAKSRVKA